MNKTVALVCIYKYISTDNYIFTHLNAGLGDNMFQPYKDLKAAWGKNGINVCTPDTVNINNIDIFIFMDMPDDSNEYFIFAKEHNIPMYLLMQENALIWMKNLNISKHNYFKKIFTYLDELVDNEKYYKINYSHKFPDSIPKNTDRKLCTLIAGCRTAHRISDRSLELYSKRIEAIRWFEKYHPEEFDLYGIGWDKKHKFQGSRVKKFFNRIGLIRWIFTRKYPSYRGKVDKKFDVLKKYKFSICYENCKNIKGYITEKIFDCFFAGCVPIYWGADNIADHIPETCFIDKRKFDTYEHLYQYITSMSKEQYFHYLDAIENFLRSEKGYYFSTDYFTQTLTKEIIVSV